MKPGDLDQFDNDGQLNWVSHSTTSTSGPELTEESRRHVASSAMTTNI
jgi:hypothetical protein